MLYRNAENDDYRAILKFEKKVFKKDFSAFLPKVYSSENLCADTHIICKDGEKICGALCVYPMQLHLGDIKMQVVGIGSVAVDKKYRRQGIMKKMMELSEERAEKLKASVGVLCGARKRYERYGYVPCGEEYVFGISQYSIEHYKTDEIYSLREIVSDNDFKDFYFLYNKQEIKMERDIEAFENIIHSWECKAYCIEDKESYVIGYIVASHDGNVINDLIIKDIGKIENMIFSYIKNKKKKSLCVHLRCHQTDLIAAMLAFAENYHVETAGMFKIFDYKSFIETAMQYKLKKTALEEGSVKVKINDDVYQITVNDQKCNVNKVKSDFDIELNTVQATTFFTSNFNTITDNNLLKSWLPFCMLSISAIDKV